MKQTERVVLLLHCSEEVVLKVYATCANNEALIIILALSDTSLLWLEI